MNEAIHQIRICVNPECACRFPVTRSDQTKQKCPRCGSDTQPVREPYESYLIQEKQPDPPAPRVVAVLDNLRSALNVGAIFRTADGAGISGLYLCGITPPADNPKVVKTALGAEKAIRWEHRWNCLETVEELKQNGFQLWALEGGSGAINLFRALGKINPDKPIALIVGNEVSGVDPAVVECCDRSVYIPMSGIKESLNVATAFGVAAYFLRYGKSIS